jgi:aspartyl-tRNA(Asn)/glutamyl-tRNA(Gln) amidotransferase subunit A
MISDFTDPIVASGVVGLADMFAKGAATPVDALEVSLLRIERFNGALNAVLAVDRQGAARDAEASARRWAGGAQRSKLDGVPIAIKANIAVEGLPWHGGIEAYRDRVAERDADSVRRLRQAGAVIVGVLNLHEAALGATNDNLAFGRCHNPYRHGFTPGGSSGGSAAAVAAGLCAAALGTDTLGSVRIPAAYCGVFGHKPSHGLLPTGGVMSLSTTFDDLGVLASSARDLSAVLGVLANWDADCGYPDGVSEPIRCAVVDLAGQVELDTSVRAAFEQAVEAAQAAGWRVDRLALDGWDAASLRRLSLLVVEVEALAEHGAMLARNPLGFSPSLRGMLNWAARQAPDKVADAQAQLKSAVQGLRRQVSSFDAILTPTTAAPAFSFDVAPPHDQADFTVPANLSGLAATAFPLGVGSGDMPLSAQIISVSDALAIRLAGRLARSVSAPRSYL